MRTAARGRLLENRRKAIRVPPASVAAMHSGGALIKNVW
jgi:hypothetical protein